MKIMFSIIIPVYNTPPNLLDRCINSIFKQKTNNYEIIIVDDGSEQSCAEYIDNLAEKNYSIHPYHIKNQGVSHARNYGVSKVSGEWIIFVDADDIIAPYMLDQSEKAINKYLQVDLVYGYTKYISDDVFDTCFVNSKPRTRWLNDDEKYKLLRHMIALEDSAYRMPDGAYLSRGPVARVISRRLAEKKRFPIEMPLGEDEIWNINILKEKPNVAIVESVWYGYIYNRNSSSKKYRKNILIDEVKRLNGLHDLLGDNEHLYPSLLLKTLEVFHEMMDTYYLHDEYTKSIMFADREFRKDTNIEPFRRYLKLKYMGKLKKTALLHCVIWFYSPFPVSFFFCYQKMKKIIKKQF